MLKLKQIDSFPEIGFKLRSLNCVKFNKKFAGVSIKFSTQNRLLTAKC